MRKPLSLGVLLAIAISCSMGGPMVTWESFSEVPVGATQNEVVQTVGKPYAIHSREDGSLEYEYIERFKVGYRNMQTRRYYIIIKDGKVVSKRYDQNSPLPYYLENFDSYEMQTTQNGQE
jgi:outer membrane protein assembly factor BamE (lipoprotein component of BamABCDE complex)